MTFSIVFDYLNEELVSMISWCTFYALTPLLGIYLVMVLCWKWVTLDESNVDPQNRIVIITGCDTGFGHTAALELAKKGFLVVAGCLKESSTESFEHRNILCVKLDVLCDQDIENLTLMIGQMEGIKLHAIINNAGVPSNSLFDWSDIENYRQVMEVNFFAPLRLIKKLMPYIKRDKTRIINIGSIAGIIPGMKFMSAYSASKHALEAFSSSLRYELRDFGIKVILINPTFHKTPMVKGVPSLLRETWLKLPDNIREEYGERFYKRWYKSNNLIYDYLAWSPKRVIKAYVDAVTLRVPKQQYIVGLDKDFLLLFSMLPLQVRDLVVRMLDA